MLEFIDINFILTILWKDEKAESLVTISLRLQKHQGWDNNLSFELRDKPKWSMPFKDA